MKSINWSTATLFLSIAISTALAEPIAVSDLYISPEHPAVDLSPDGQFILDYRRADTHSIDIINSSSMEVTSQVNIDAEIRVLEIYWLSANHVFLSYQKGRSERSKIGKVTNGKLTFRDMARNTKIIGIVDELSGELVVSLSRKNGGIYKLATTSAEQLYTKGSNSYQTIDVDTDDNGLYTYDRKFKTILAAKINAYNKTVTIASASIEGGKWKWAGSVNLDENRFYPVGFLSESKIAVLTDHGATNMVLREYDLQGHTYGDILYQHPNFDLTDARIRSDGEIDFVTYEQHGLKVRDYLHKESAKLALRFQKTFAGQDVHIADHSVDNSKMLLYVSGPSNPGEFFMYRKSQDLIEALFKNHPKLAKTTLMPTHRVAARASDDTLIEGFLVVPAQGEINLNTLLVIPHGGPIGINDSADFNPESQYYASRGFSVLRVNFRGSFGYGRKFLQEGIGQFGGLIESDISAVVTKVLQQYKLSNLCALGASYGGYSSVMLAISHPELYKCVVGSFGVYDLPLLFNHSNRRVFNTQEIEGIVGEYRESLRDVSPTYLVNRLKAPTLLIAGYDDNIARFEHSNRLKYLLEKSGLPVETLFYMNTGHGHKSFLGDRLDAATSYLFILKSLGMEVPNINTLRQPGQSALAEDYITIADGYMFNKDTESDDAKAYSYYMRAAQYGNARAQFNVGTILRKGIAVDQDLVEAYYWLSKASDNGYVKASKALAEQHEQDSDQDESKQVH
jgi:dipeptidyl aminopeptidase/acylaminoacyl peptidase